MTTVTRILCPCPQASREASSIKASRPEDYQSSRRSSNLVNEPPSRPPHAKALKTGTVAEAKREPNAEYPRFQHYEPRYAVDRDVHRRPRRAARRAPRRALLERDRHLF